MKSVSSVRNKMKSIKISKPTSALVKTEFKNNNRVAVATSRAKAKGMGPLKRSKMC